MNGFRHRLLVAALRVLAGLSSAGAVAQLDRFGGGGASRSPDGRWRVWSRAPADAEAAFATAWLSGPGVARRRLMDYEREVRVIWMGMTPHVVLTAQTAHLATINLFRLGARQPYPADRAQREMEATLAAIGPALARVENRAVAPGGSFGFYPCLLMMESGLPPGQRTGPFISREQAFRLDLTLGNAVPVRRCPGAVIE